MNTDWSSKPENRDATVRFLRALYKGAQWYADPKNKDEAIQIMQTSAKYPAEYAKRGFEIYVEQAKALPSDLKLNVAGMKASMDVMNQSGAVKPLSNNPMDYVDVSYWEAATGKKFQ